MHEWALAEGVITTAQKFAEENGLNKVTEVVIMIGELQQIDHDVLEFTFEQLKTELFKDAKFVLKTQPAKFKCRVCGNEWDFKAQGLTEDISEAIHFVPEMAHVYVKCTHCESPDFEVTQGRGVWLATIKGEKDDE
ncbi:hydrogenase nickel incorporation protein HypA [Candidatus Bathyarchaeota archaeon]|jgi:hydrogenase nickel incorporation protein HypA/HybF|nr:hydrogenase nickel incorporation protein HypA [Candidatus Bathyarchaeota archaeon]MBT4321134.1 hydrogenase nickel incorporation protein HypA [Candidatus Bathyarchaeota archaeon]MBT4424569.1 hydrogenase nickel incorporation protein HypA [Candidatus Bathyarchaeota archaeon]MBT6604279.1 hydrogenase nickel incorporation protein HypA [Candidatus Bathyarchaeota archaeon]MBT7187449.1 hydrogenase nickel incorporation protein HypA [Candidatus Bathyarchaeota archaeon]